MASYGIGPSRVMGTIVEVSHDTNGIIWPQEVAPFTAHLVSLGKSEDVKTAAEQCEKILIQNGIETLFDDRDASPAEKLKDADLLGIPHRIIVSERTKDRYEYRKRSGGKPTLVSQEELLAILMGT